jgi:glycosyltransferase involved in cell wall biosynthesis
MISEQTKLTVFIPTYNRCDSLKACLDGLAFQVSKRKDVRVCVSNNASTDGTEDLLKEYSQKYCWLTYETNKVNIGGVQNQLKAFQLPFKSEFVWMIGDDDYVTQNAINDICNIIELNKPFNLIFCNTMAFDTKQKDEVLDQYIKSGCVDKGSYKSRVEGEFLTHYQDLINPFVADSYLLELMCLCFRQSFITKQSVQEIIDLNITEDWFDDPDTSFDRAGKYFCGGLFPIFNTVTAETVCFYSVKPRTFNFWGSAEWIGDYDYVFPIALLYMIFMYRNKKIIKDEKVIQLLDYYFSIMSKSIQRQFSNTSTARPFTTDQKNMLAKIMAYYITKSLPNEI